jgi:alpha-mannosidase II
VDIRHFDNSEIAMRLTTDMKTGDHFATDLNGFQMIKRKRLDKLPIQANYYPIPSMAYIQVLQTGITMTSENRTRPVPN